MSATNVNGNVDTTAPLIELRDVTKVFGGGMLSQQETVALSDFPMRCTRSRPRSPQSSAKVAAGKPPWRT